MRDSALIAIAIVVAAASFVLARRRRRSEMALLEPAPIPPSVSKPPAMPEEPEINVLVPWLLERAFDVTGVRVADDPMARQRIAQASVKALAELRTHDSTTVSLPFLTADASGPKHFEVRVTRDTLRALTP